MDSARIRRAAEILRDRAKAMPSEEYFRDTTGELWEQRHAAAERVKKNADEMLSLAIELDLLAGVRSGG